MSEERNDGVSERAEVETSTWEWMVAIVSALVVLGAVGYVFYKAAVEPTTPPRIEFSIEEVHAVQDGYLVEFWAHNRGARTAKDLTVEGQLLGDTGEVAVRSATFTFVPGESKRRGGLFFPVNPELYRLKLYPIGYDAP